MKTVKPLVLVYCTYCKQKSTTYRNDYGHEHRKARKGKVSVQTKFSSAHGRILHHLN